MSFYIEKLQIELSEFTLEGEWSIDDYREYRDSLPEPEQFVEKIDNCNIINVTDFFEMV